MQRRSLSFFYKLNIYKIFINSLNRLLSQEKENTYEIGSTPPLCLYRCFRSRLQEMQCYHAIFQFAYENNDVWTALF